MTLTTRINIMHATQPLQRRQSGCSPQAPWEIPCGNFGSSRGDEAPIPLVPKRLSRLTHRPPPSRSVLDCGSPPPLFHRTHRGSGRDSRVAHSTRVVKAPEDWRTPKPGGRGSGSLGAVSARWFPPCLLTHSHPVMGWLWVSCQFNHRPSGSAMISVRAQ